MTAYKPNGTSIDLDRLQAVLETDPANAARLACARLDEDPLDANAYRLLAAAKASLQGGGEATGAVLASSVSGADARLRHAAAALGKDDLPTAEAIVRTRLIEAPTDVQALRMLAEIARRLMLDTGAENLLRYAIELRPGFWAAKLDLARLFRSLNRNEEALDFLDQVLAQQPMNDSALYLKAVVLGQAGRSDESVNIYEALVERSPHAARLWASYGRALKTVGKSEQGVTAFRRATDIDPALGEAWWSLSDLKTVRLDQDDIATMEHVLHTRDLDEKDRYYIHFALGKAFEDQHVHDRSFTHYAEGNRLRRLTLDYDSERFTRFVDAARSMFDERFFFERAGAGSAVPDPIFILGMTRAGSTLIEQILASHPQVEGTMELPEMLAIARSLCEEFEGRVAAIGAVPRQELTALGERYIRDTRRYRQTTKPFFIDKMPNNWLYVPLIQLTLPNAKIIDARRHPMACCFSNFKQNFGRGQDFSYDLGDLGSYYRNYVRMMAHNDRVLPGRIHRLYHEDLVEQPEREIRRLLEYLDLPFDDRCLRFHENRRAVRTASAEQVRRPINREGIELWHHYDPWLEPLRAALGPVLDYYPAVPSFDD